MYKIRLALALLVALMLSQTADAQNWLQKGKNFHKIYIPSGVEPSNALLLEIAQATVSYRVSWWRTYLSKLDSIHPTLPNATINPAEGSDPWDVGTLDEDGNFTPFSVAQRNTALAFFGPWSYREYEIKPALKALRKARNPLGAGADAETPKQALARREAEAQAYATTQIGNEDAEVPDQ